MLIVTGAGGEVAEDASGDDGGGCDATRGRGFGLGRGRVDIAVGN